MNIFIGVKIKKVYKCISVFFSEELLCGQEFKKEELLHVTLKIGFSSK